MKLYVRGSVRVKAELPPSQAEELCEVQGSIYKEKNEIELPVVVFMLVRSLWMFLGVTPCGLSRLWRKGGWH